MGATVSVGCKLPNGHILQLYEQYEVREVMPGGSLQTTVKARRTGKTYVLNKARMPFGIAPEHQIVRGMSITHGIDADFWEAWLAQNKDTDLVQSGIIFAHAKSDAVASEAINRATVRHGLEPITPNTDARIPKAVSKGVGAPMTADVK